MGSFDRGLDREEAKRQYKMFAKNWSIEKFKRSTTLDKDGKKIKEQLGMRPSFNQWFKHVKAQMANPNSAAEVEEQIDTEWKEEVVTPVNGGLDASVGGK